MNLLGGSDKTLGYRKRTVPKSQPIIVALNVVQAMANQLPTRAIRKKRRVLPGFAGAAGFGGAAAGFGAAAAAGAAAGETGVAGVGVPSDMGIVLLHSDGLRTLAALGMDTF